MTNYLNKTGLTYLWTKIKNMFASKTDIQTIRQATFSATGWSTSAPYTQTVSVSGITSTDSPIVGLYIAPGTSAATLSTNTSAYNLVSYFDTGNGNITATCITGKPAGAFTINIKGI